MSRIYGVTIGDNRVSVLVPYADMQNHSKPPSRAGKPDEANVPFLLLITCRYHHWLNRTIIIRASGALIKRKRASFSLAARKCFLTKRSLHTTPPPHLSVFICAFAVCCYCRKVLDSCGRKCNSRFFVNYGMTIDDNPDNEGSFIRMDSCILCNLFVKLVSD